MILRFSALILALLFSCTAVIAASFPPDLMEFREMYREVVETNATLSTGSCTLADERMGAHLRGAGLSEQHIHVLVSRFRAAPDPLL